MANQSAKRILAQNKRILTNLNRLVIGAHAVGLLFGLVIPLVRGTFSFSFGKALLHLANSGTMLVMQKLLTDMARPNYDFETGEVSYEGTDLSMSGGMVSLYFDLVYMTSFVLVTATVFSAKFWLVHLITIGGVLYIAYKKLVAPVLAARKAAKESQQQNEPKEKAASRAVPSRKRRGFGAASEVEVEGRNRRERRQNAKEAKKKRLQ